MFCYLFTISIQMSISFMIKALMDTGSFWYDLLLAIRRAVSADVVITKYAFYPVPLRPATAIAVPRIGLHGC